MQAREHLNGRWVVPESLKVSPVNSELKYTTLIRTSQKPIVNQPIWHRNPKIPPLFGVMLAAAASYIYHLWWVSSDLGKNGLRRTSGRKKRRESGRRCVPSASPSSHSQLFVVRLATYAVIPTLFWKNSRAATFPA